jgi:hypothetical protein
MAYVTELSVDGHQYMVVPAAWPTLYAWVRRPASMLGARPVFGLAAADIAGRE